MRSRRGSRRYRAATAPRHGWSSPPARGAARPSSGRWQRSRNRRRRGPRRPAGHARLAPPPPPSDPPAVRPLSARSRGRQRVPRGARRLSPLHPSLRGAARGHARLARRRRRAALPGGAAGRLPIGGPRRAGRPACPTRRPGRQAGSPVGCRQLRVAGRPARTDPPFPPSCEFDEMRLCRAAGLGGGELEAWHDQRR